MFTPTTMHKINIFIQEEDIGQVAVALARLESLDLSEPEQRGDWRGAQQERWRELANTYANQTRRVENLLDVLNISHRDAPPPETVRPRRDAETLAEQLEKIEQAVRDWDERRSELSRRRKRLRRLEQEMRLLEPLDLSVEELRSLEYLHLQLVTIPKERLDNLRVTLFNIPFVIVPIHEEGERSLVLTATDQPHAPILERALNSLFAEPVPLPEDFSGTPTDILAMLGDQLADIEAQQAKLEQEKGRLVQKWEAPLLKLWRRADSNATGIAIINQLARHGDVYLLTGWVPETALDEVTQTVQNSAPGRADVEVVEPVVGGRLPTPTLLRNPAFLRPFETIVSTFGFPAYDEIDPTPLVALTFVLMYGMMFGDVGHGLLLALLGGWVWQRSQGMAAAIGAILTISGLSGTLFGFLYGSIFGLEHILPHVWLSPLGSISSILLAAIAAGVGLLNLGFLLNLIVAWRAQAWGRLLFGQNGLAGIWLYWALIGGAVALWQGWNLSLSLWFLLLLIPALLIFLHEPLSHLLSGHRPLLEQGWGEYSVEAFFELFETVIADISNSLSFVRLGAFAVAHAGLSQVVFALADLSGGGPGRWLVLIIGTIFIVGFEGLIVGIQALRLEYYEFFNKFFGGRGRVFEPLTLSKQAEQV